MESDLKTVKQECVEAMGAKEKVLSHSLKQNETKHSQAEADMETLKKKLQDEKL